MYQSSLANLVTCIVMLGLDSAGKTTIFSNLMIKKSVETIPTYVFNVDTEGRISEARKELFSILETPEAWGLPLIIIGDRPDLPHMLESQELAQELSLSAQSKLLARPRGICHN
ncbi:unnamed protein product [Pocillopora meandrina]|uniref:Uncharacterized protein n=1 Tax=Pocillopora meandrina TaxID=46732 RepID=A0AAU9X943_9CNID|nr:unnamed protein product [Pocillopora meandrina]